VRTFTDALGEPPLLVANDPDAAGWHPGLRVSADVRPGLGSLGGILTAVQAAPAPVVCVAWDMPFVTAALLALLRAEGERSGTTVLPTRGRPPRPEPLCAYYAADALAACDALLHRGERRAAALFESLPGARTLQEEALAELGDPARLLLSVDTLEDLATLGGRLPDGEDTARR
jgi:molybdopterin-guanine dinucleotide biosynthesis protein A